jgi:DNA repair photolyase
MMAPILPGLTDSAEQIDRTVAAIAAAGAKSVTPLVLHLRPGAREWYTAWLNAEYPHLAPRYEELYRRGSYAPKSYQETITVLARQAARRYGLQRYRPGEFRETGEQPEVPPQSHQLALM